MRIGFGKLQAEIETLEARIEIGRMSLRAGHAEPRIRPQGSDPPAKNQPREQLVYIATIGARKRSR